VSNAAIAPLCDGACITAFGLVGPALAQRGRPAAAIWLLTIASCVAAAASTVVLMLLSLPLVGLDDSLADQFHWTSAVLRKDTLAGRGVAVVAAASVLLFVLRAARVVVRNRLAARAARAQLRRLGPAAGGLLVADDRVVDAFTVAGSSVIVATTGLLRLLSPGERRAMLAHERSHLVHRHHAHVLAATVAAALNPLLWRVPDTVTFVAERWADEDAAGATSRPVAAAALARAAESRSTFRPVHALAAAATAVARRIAALQAPPPSARPVAFAVPALLIVAAVFTTAVATDHVWALFHVTARIGRHALLQRH